MTIFDYLTSGDRTKDEQVWQLIRVFPELITELKEIVELKRKLLNGLDIDSQTLINRETEFLHNLIVQGISNATKTESICK